MSARRKMCVHHVYEDRECERCEELVRTGKVKVRPLYSQQRVWQLEQKASNRCEICGRNKGKSGSKARCMWCLEKDGKRHRKKHGWKRKWRPGDNCRPRKVRGGENTIAQMKATDDRRDELNEGELVALSKATRKIFRGAKIEAHTKVRSER